jgi:small subunit ribosomal protein S1
LAVGIQEVETQEAAAEPVATVGGAEGKPKARKRRVREQLPDWLKEELDYKRPRRHEVREAIILEKSDNDIIVDIGAKRDGVVTYKDMERLDEDYLANLEVGDKVPVAVLRTWEDTDGIVVSINLGLQRQDWLRAQEMLESREVIEAEVIDHNRGGVLASFGRLRGFVPNSHLNAVPRGTRGDRLCEIKSNLVGQTLSFVVIEVSQRHRRLVLSERTANYVKREQLLQELTEGEVRTGTVCNLVDFGAFIDLGGIDGLVHISELDWNYVAHPSDVLEPGQEIEVYVLDVDRERERIALSRKRLLPNPWYAITDELQVGHVVEGTVTSLADFGAFVDVGKGVEGLVHISEMPAGKVTMEELASGQEVGVRVLKIDHDQRRIALSMRGIAHQIGQSVPSSVWEGRSGESAAERGAEDA